MNFKQKYQAQMQSVKPSEQLLFDTAQMLKAPVRRKLPLIAGTALAAGIVLCATLPHYPQAANDVQPALLAAGGEQTPVYSEDSASRSAMPQAIELNQAELGELSQYTELLPARPSGMDEQYAVYYPDEPCLFVSYSAGYDYLTVAIRDFDPDLASDYLDEISREKIVELAHPSDQGGYYWQFSLHMGEHLLNYTAKADEIAPIAEAICAALPN